MARARPAARHLAMGGLIGAACSLVVLLLGRSGGGSPGLLELVADAIVRVLPPPVLDTLLRALGDGAKGLLYAGIGLGMLVAGALLGVALGRLGLVRPSHPVSGAIAATLAAAGLAELVVLPLAGAGFAGTRLLSDATAVHLPLLVAAGVFGSVVALWASATGRTASTVASAPAAAGGLQPSTEPVGVSRRALMTRALGLLGATALVVSGGVIAARSLAVRRPALSGNADAPGVEGFGFVRAVTPVPEFYVVSKDWVPVAVDADTWRLRVSGLVERPRAWTLADIRGLPVHESHRTLQCISAESITRTELIGNQVWRGARVRDVLDQAGVLPGAAWVVWRCADGYHESLDIATAQLDDTWLVYEMGPAGTPLTPDHGFPLRLLVAGRYGMAQPKYLTDLILASEDQPGWWVAAGWRTDAPVRTYCRIDLPAADGISDAVLAGTAFTAYGVASAGDRGISAVQVSEDGGATWRDAELEPPGGPIGRLTWVRWRARVRLDAPGTLLFTARAADGTGAWQEDTLEEPFPRGASGYPRVPMRVYPSLPES